VVKSGTVRDPAAAPRAQTGARLRLSDYVPAASAIGGVIERTFAAGPEFITPDPKDSAPGVAPYQRTVYYQLEVADALEPLRPGDTEFHFRAIRSVNVVFETDGLIAEVPGPARTAPGDSALPVRESQVHCEFVSALPPVLESQISHLPSHTKATIGSGFGKAVR
jgi:hypothetical protein